MKQIWKKALVLLGIFIAAVVIYFVWYQKGEENTNQVFSTMESVSYTHLIQKHEDVLHACSSLLIEKEKIGQKEFEELFSKKPIEI